MTFTWPLGCIEIAVNLESPKKARELEPGEYQVVALLNRRNSSISIVAALPFIFFYQSNANAFPTARGPIPTATRPSSAEISPSRASSSQTVNKARVAAIKISQPSAGQFKAEG